ncbi:MAG: hypothetical protein ACYDHG_13800 [Desulfomonilaceae bacterium]
MAITDHGLGHDFDHWLRPVIDGSTELLGTQPFRAYEGPPENGQCISSWFLVA